MKPLPKELKKKGFTYRQVVKTPKGYIYSQTHPSGTLIGYEVFLHKENTRHNCVSFPGDNAFGVWAWSVRTLEKAKMYLD